MLSTDQAAELDPSTSNNKPAADQASQRSPLADTINRPSRTVAERRTSTWINAHASPKRSAASSTAGKQAHKHSSADAAATQVPRKPQMSRGAPVVWHVDFAGEPVVMPDSGSASAHAAHLSTDLAEHNAPAASSAVAIGAQEQSELRARPGSQHPLAQPQSGGLTQMTDRRMRTVAAAKALPAAAGADVRRAASQVAATRSTTRSPRAKIYKDLQPVASRSAASPAAVKKLAARRRTAVLAQMPRTDSIAPSLRDLWRAEEHIVEARRLTHCHCLLCTCDMVRAHSGSCSILCI